MRITGLGHAGLYVETNAGTVLCDPWRSPAYFASWFPFPDNSGVDWDACQRPDYLYVSHLHRDHFDPEALGRVAKSATVLLPDYPTDELRTALAELGFRRFVTTRSDEPVELDGLRVMIQALAGPTDGPIGDSLLALDDGRHRLLNQNDAHPHDLDPVSGFGPFDAHLLQFSGAIWYPVAYRLPGRAMAELGRRKRRAGLDRAHRYAAAVGARYVFPVAGPPCFLDDDLFHLNDLYGDDCNVFPDQRVFLAELTGRGTDAGRLLLPGTLADLAEPGCPVRHQIPEEEIERIFNDKAGYLHDYAARARPRIEAEHAQWPRPGLDVLAELKARFEPLLADAPHLRAGVGAPVLLEVGDQPLVIDFPARQVRPWAGERCRYQFQVARPLVEHLIATGETDWVNSLFLSCRFSARRIGRYNEHLYTFFKCLSPTRLEYVERWYAEQNDPGPEVPLGDWLVQRHCPHLRSDLTRFGEIDDAGVLTCHTHGWRFDLATGRCLTAEGHSINARRREPADAVVASRS
jgi:UDP-MurNAc hydroxylase